MDLQVDWFRRGLVGLVIAPVPLLACSPVEQGGLPGVFGSATDGQIGDDGGGDDESGSGSSDGSGDDGSGGGDQDEGDDGVDDGVDDGGSEGSDDAVDVGESGDCEGPEVCDGIDNDCDDEIDEEDPDVGGACESGEAGLCATGLYACEAGALVCVPDNAPVAETCNGLDDDCDGTVDNGDPGGGEDCDTGLPGECAAGVTACGSDGSPACDQLVVADDESCNGLDDDCNGTVDDNIAGVGNGCSTGQFGVCSAGTYQCDGTQIDCVANVTAAPTDTCGNGTDDDCDGVVDDGCGCNVCTVSTSPLASGCSSCASAVCAADGYCCTTAWDSICVDEVTLYCTESCSCAHGVCATGSALSSGCHSCVGTVCAFDSYCCTTSWDATCVLEAEIYCGAC